SGNLNYVASSPIGPYLETGPAGHVETWTPTGGDGDYFAYTLSGLTVGQPYEVQVDYPDNAQRTFAISIEEGATQPTDGGVASGGPYDVSGLIQTYNMVFYPTRSDPRLLFLTWHNGQRAAVQEIRVYALTTPNGYTTPYPALNNGNLPANGRTNSLYFEQPGMIPGYFGAPYTPAVSDWNMEMTAVSRLAQWSRYEGINQWFESVDAYGMDMSPYSQLYGYTPVDEVGGNVLYNVGVASSKDIFQKDLIRFELLTAQQYGISYIPELQPGIDGDLAQQLDRLWGGDGNLNNNLLSGGAWKSWISVSNSGSYTTGGPNSNAPYYNFFDPHVQAWVTSLVLQMANRYADSPALQGIALRLMGWQFSGMFSVDSLTWGYEDSTINSFRAANPALGMPNYTDANRFSERYSWLMANAKQLWINWRAQQVTNFYQSLITQLQAIARPNGGAPLKLFIDAYGSSFDLSVNAYTDASNYDSKGYVQQIKEAGIDLPALRAMTGLTFINTTSYPAGIRNANGNNYLSQAAQDQAFDPAPIQASAVSVTGGTVAAVKFGNEYFEDGFNGSLGTSPNWTYTTVWMAGTAVPAGVNDLARYAAAMAAGNITSFGDGGYGYNIGQPTYLRPFMTEYLSLPNIGMQKLSSATDPVALWYGTQNGNLEFYLVNQADYAVTVTVTLGGTPALYRLSSGASVATSGGAFTVTLQPFQLLAYENRGSTTPPTAFSAVVPVATTQTLNQQLSFVSLMLNDLGGQTLYPLAYTQYQAAQTAISGGHYWAARMALMNHNLV
ncbi:MAG: hypothetical protein WCI73_15000, partial [Phycisphaerae bacterium]